MDKIVIALTLALAAYADIAKADMTVTTPKGTLTLSDNSIYLEATGTVRNQDGAFFNIQAMGCTRMSGDFVFSTLVMENNVLTTRLLGVAGWVRDSEEPMSKLVTALCRKALAKEVGK
jgi:hypothetical protein